MKKLYLPEVKQNATQFIRCRQLDDLRVLGINANLVRLLTLHPPYHTFEMRKKNGSFRTIEAPNHQLKSLQRQFNRLLQCVYYLLQPAASHGYIMRVKGRRNNKNILENARRHLGAGYLLNVDFQSFFHQVSRQRIQELLQGPPFQFAPKAAVTLARLFTHKQRLPMGAPTSPVLSNLISIPLDHQLDKWAQQHSLVYTRFVDDLTFSSRSAPITTEQLAAIQEMCTQQQLRLNEEKTHFYGPDDIKKVTGLVLNDTVDIDPTFYRELQEDLLRLRRLTEVHLIVNKHRQDEVVQTFKKEVEGQINFIGMIEGFDSSIFYDHRQQLRQALHPQEEILSVRWTNAQYF
ncbi:MAG: reverse transcriptase family protein [Bacteroidota bacterium]